MSVCSIISSHADLHVILNHKNILSHNIVGKHTFPILEFLIKKSVIWYIYVSHILILYFLIATFIK